MVKIDGITYDVPIMACKRIADFLDKKAERVTSGDLDRELIGVFFTYQMDFGLITDAVEYDALYQKLTEPVEFHTVEVPTSLSTLTYKAYFSQVSDEVVKQINGITYFKGLSVKFISKSPNRK